MRFPPSVRRRYEWLTRFPDGSLVVGAAVASFNSIYGQDMSVPAIEALTLGRQLKRGVAPQPRRLFRDLARVVNVPWGAIVVGGDLVFPGVQGYRTLSVRPVNAYLGRLHAAAAHDARLASAFVQVAGLVASPEPLRCPGIVLRVLRGSLHPATGIRGRLQHRATVRAAQTPGRQRDLSPNSALQTCRPDTAEGRHGEVLGPQ